MKQGCLVLLAVLMTACGTEDSSDGLSLSKGFGSTTASGVSDGAQESTSCDEFYPAAPQHVVTLEENFLALHIETDTVDAPFMVVFGQSNFCSKTDTGLPAVSRAAWTKGDYQIFVGSASQGGSVAYKMAVREGVAQ